MPGPVAPAVIDDNFVKSRILTIRGVQVMLDRDLAMLYGVDAKRINEQVKRNAECFPDDFMFRLTKEDCLRSQIATLNMERGKHLKYMPYAFTESGVAMLSGVLRSSIAVDVNIRIMRAFVAMRRAIASIAPLLARIEATDRRQIADQARNDENQNRNEERFKLILDAMRDRTFPPQKVFFDGQVYDAFEQMKRFVRMAKARRSLAEPPRKKVLRVFIPGQVQHPGHRGEDLTREGCAQRLRRRARPVVARFARPTAGIQHSVFSIVRAARAIQHSALSIQHCPRNARAIRPPLSSPPSFLRTGPPRAFARLKRGYPGGVPVWICRLGWDDGPCREWHRRDAFQSWRKAVFGHIGLASRSIA